MIRPPLVPLLAALAQGAAGSGGDADAAITAAGGPAIGYAPGVLAAAVFAVGLVVGAGVALAIRWGTREARRGRMAAAMGGQLVVVRHADGRCEGLAVPPRLAALFTAPPTAGAELPPWRPEIAGVLDTLAVRAGGPPAGAAQAECLAAGIRLRLVGVQADEDTLLVSIAEAGPDAARVNQLETAALLSGGIAHDLRNVLNTLVLHADVGSDHVAAPMRVLDHFDRIRTGALRAADLVTLLRRQLRGGGPPGVARPAPVAVADTVHEVVELLRPAFPRALLLDVASVDRGAWVLAAEPVQLHQVALNLVLNAIQALDGHAAPRLRVSVALEPGPLDDVPPADAPRPVPGAATTATREATPARRTDAHVVLAVEDNGPGIPPDVRARCFDPYFTTRPDDGGTGLGLAVVRAVVEEVLGGRVQVEDAAGGGARFVVRLPAAPPPAADVATSPAARAVASTS